MAGRTNHLVFWCKSYYSILKRLLIDGKVRQSQPFLSILIKEYGLVDPKISKILLHYLCLKDVRIAVHFLNNMNGRNSANTFPVCVLKELTRDGRVLDAYKLVMGAKYNLPIMNVVNYSIIIDALCKGGHPGKALNLCTFAEKKGIILNIVTYNSVINGLCCQGCLIEAFRLFDSLERLDLIPSEVTYSILIDNLCKRGYLFDAKQLFERMVLKGYKSNRRIYNSFLNGYCKYGQIEEALKIQNNMEIECIDPDEFTVSALINGYCQNSDLEGALSIFSQYKGKTVLPDLLGFSYLIRGLYSKGRMEEARGILREMLQSLSVMDMVNRVTVPAEIESIESFLSFLCEQGSIREAIIVLNEVVSAFFPVQKWYGHYHESQELQKSCELQDSGMVVPSDIPYPERSNLDFSSDDVIEADNKAESSNETGKYSEVYYFDLYYLKLASLCSRGEVDEASRLAKKMLCSLSRGR